MNALKWLPVIAGAMLLAACQDDAAPSASAPSRSLSEPLTIQTLPGIEKVEVRWRGGGQEAAGYRLAWQRAAAVDQLAPQIELGGDTRHYTHAGLVGGTPYHYRVAVVSADGTATWSAEAVAVPADAGRPVRSDAIP